MKMIQMLILSGTLATVAATSAAHVTIRSCVQDQSSQRVTVSYSVDTPVIVTADVRTNRGDGAYFPVASRDLRFMVGEIDKLVTNVNTTVTFTWKPEMTLGSLADVQVAVTAWETNAPPTFMVYNLLDMEQVRYYVDEDRLPYPLTDDIYKTEWLAFRKIPAKDVTWRMGVKEGDSPSQSKILSDPHDVTFTDDYYMGVYPVTVRHWQLAVRCGDPTGSDYSKSTTDRRRAVWSTSYNYLRGGTGDGIDWPTTKHEVKSGSPIDSMRGYLGIEVDLPTEAQWEYAARAGVGSPIYSGETANETNVAKLAQYQGNVPVNASQPVGEKSGNVWGLYDFYGNVYEWCLDWMDYDLYLKNYPTTDPKGLLEATAKGTRAMRGGAWNSGWSECVSAYRNPVAPNSNWANLGFRVAAPAVAPHRAK